MGPNTQWRWSEKLRQWYYPRIDNNGRLVLVLENGGIVPAPGYNPPEPSSTPRAPQLPDDRTILQQPAQPSRNGGNSPAYTYRPTGPQSQSQGQGQNQLAEQLRRANIADRVDPGSNTARPLEYCDVQSVQGRNGVNLRIARNREGEVLLETPGDQERLDPNFKKRSRPRDFFKIGKVFFTLWTEATTASASNAAFSTVRFGEKAHSQIRRFVVVEERSNYCIAAQITTYGGQGVAKNGVVKGEHAIIYTGTQAPPMLPGEQSRRGEAPLFETPIQVDPIQVDPSQPPERLDPKSRVNLGKATAVEHNLKVKPCGMVRNIDALREAYDQVRGTGFSRNITIPNPGRPTRQPSSGGRSGTYSPSSPPGPSSISVPSSAMRVGSMGSGSTAESLPRGSGMMGPGSPPQVGSMQSRAAQLAATRRSVATGTRQQDQEEEKEEQGDEEDSSGEEDSEEEDESEDETPPSRNRPSQQPPRPPQGRGGGSASGGQQRQRPSQRAGNQSGYYRRS